jgi:hypothetical protein
MTAPFCSLTHFAPYHFSGYNHYWYTHHLPMLGFKIEEIVANGTWFSFIAQELRRSRVVGEMYSSGLLGLITRIWSFSYPLLIWAVFGWLRDIANRWYLDYSLDKESVTLFAMMSSIALIPPAGIF